MSCGLQRPRAGQPLSWEPNPTVQNEYWAQRNRQNLKGIVPCRTKSYYYSPNSSDAFGYKVQQPWQFGNNQGHEFWRDPNQYFAFGNYGANYLISQPAVGAYAVTRGACVTESGCYDNVPSCATIGSPFFSGETCSSLRQRKDINLVGLKQDVPQEKVLGEDQYIQLRKISNTGMAHDPSYGPWDNLKETWNDLMDNWRYERPAYNQ